MESVRKTSWCKVVAFAVALAATPWSAGAQSTAKEPSGELTIGLAAIPSGTLDPILVGISLKFFLAQVYDYLVGTDASGRLSKETGLARDWSANADQTRWTFKLRTDARFHNGDPVTSEDVKFSIMRAMGPKSATGYAGLLRDTVASIETPSPSEVVVVTKRPTWYIVDALSRAVSSEGMIVPKKYIEAKGDAFFNLNPIGSGPYKVIESVAGSHVRLEAAGRHWRAGTPRYKYVTIRAIPEETTRTAMLRQGKLDIADVSPAAVKELRAQGLQIHRKEGDALINCWWIESYASTPMGDKRVREALNLAINREEVADALFSGMAKPANIPLGFSWSFPEIGFSVQPGQKYAFDAARARKLIAEAGFPNGFSTKIYTAPLPGFAEAQSLAEAIGGYWGNIGVKAEVIPVDYAALRKMYVDRQVPGALMCYNQANRSAYGAFSALEKFGYVKKPTGFMHDPEIEKLHTAISEEMNPDKRNALMRQMFDRLRSESWNIPVVDVDTVYAAVKTLPKWSPGSVMFDLNLDQLVDGKP